MRLVCQISQQKYSKSLSWPWNLNFPPYALNNFRQDSNLEIFLGDLVIWHTLKLPLDTWLERCCTVQKSGDFSSGGHNVPTGSNRVNWPAQNWGFNCPWYFSICIKTKHFSEIFTLLLTTVHTVKSKVKIFTKYWR